MSFRMYFTRQRLGSHGSLLAALMLHAAAYFFVSSTEPASSGDPGESGSTGLQTLNVELLPLAVPPAPPLIIKRLAVSAQPTDVRESPRLPLSHKLRTASAFTSAPASAAETTGPASDDAALAGAHDLSDALAHGSPDGGNAGARVAGPAGSAGSGRDQLFASRKARLIQSSHRCADLFPYNATLNLLVVTVKLGVDPRGKVTEAVPTATQDQSFLLAAQTCARRLRFTPARDQRGQAVEAQAVVRLRFARAS